MFCFQVLFLFVACRTYTLRDYPQAVLGFSALDCLFDFFCGLKMAQCFESCGTLKESDDQDFLLFLLMDCIFFLHLDQKKRNILRDKKIQVSNWSSDWKKPWKKKGSSPSRFLVNGKGLFPPPTFKNHTFHTWKRAFFFKDPGFGFPARTRSIFDIRQFSKLYHLAINDVDLENLNLWKTLMNLSEWIGIIRSWNFN